MSKLPELTPAQIKRAAALYGAALQRMTEVHATDPTEIAVREAVVTRDLIEMLKLGAGGFYLGSLVQIIRHVAKEKPRKRRGAQAAPGLPCWEKTADELVQATCGLYARDKPVVLSAEDAALPLVQLTQKQHALLVRRMVAHRWPAHLFYVRTTPTGIVVYYPSTFAPTKWKPRNEWTRDQEKREHDLITELNHFDGKAMDLFDCHYWLPPVVATNPLTGQRCRLQMSMTYVSLMPMSEVMEDRLRYQRSRAANRKGGRRG